MSARYEVLIARRARKQIHDLPHTTSERVIEKIEALAEEPRPADCKKLKGRDGWRVRVGDYRVIYTIDDGKVVIVIVDVDHRRNVYR